MRKCIIRIFGLKGSWTWAKKQMMQGEIVRCRHWSGSLKYAIDSKSNKRLMQTFDRIPNSTSWEGASHFLSYEDFTDYELVKF